MYTVFEANAAPKRDRLGMVVFTRTLAQARAACEPGDTITGWSSAGWSRARWQCGADGKVRRIAQVRP